MEQLSPETPKELDEKAIHSRKLQHGTTGDQNACRFGQVVVVIEAQEGFTLMAAMVEDSGSWCVCVCGGGVSG